MDVGSPALNQLSFSCDTSIIGIADEFRSDIKVRKSRVIKADMLSIIRLFMTRCRPGLPQMLL